jgi:hypothetical protein
MPLDAPRQMESIVRPLEDGAAAFPLNPAPRSFQPHLHVQPFPTR